MEKQYLIRNAEARDCTEIAELFRSDLGYDCTDELVERKLSAIDKDREAVFVAELYGEVVGVVHVERYDLLYFEMMANILGLAVKNDYRHIGIGSDLMNAAEKWASDIGAVSVRLSSGGMRLGAHEFYRAIGYSTEKPQIRFTKNIR